MAKNNVEIKNPLASMGLDDVIRGFTDPNSHKEVKVEREEETIEDAEPQPQPAMSPAPARRGKKKFEDFLQEYTNVSEQGSAIWLPKEVKKKLEVIRANSSRSIPLRALAAAMIMAYVNENEDKLNKL